MVVRIISAVVPYVGGGEMQVARVAEELRSLGIAVEDGIVSMHVPDVVHIFGTHPRIHAPIVQHCSAKGIGCVITPVFFPAPHKSWDRLRLTVQRTLTRWGVLDGGPGHFQGAATMLRRAAVVLPNTHEEATLVRAWFPGLARVEVVPNGVDTDWIVADGPMTAESGEKFVLTVGRLEPRKNQLRLARACSGLGVRLVVVGDTAVDPRYAAACAKVRGVQLLGALPPRSIALRTMLRAAHVFALPSWCETPGIAALEAAAAGCNVVVTSVGGAKEYLGNCAEYVSASSTSEIMLSLNRSLQLPRGARGIPRFPSWREVAERYASVYNSL